jgi:hypothetical protein
MDGRAAVRTERKGSLAPPGSPPAVWAAFVAQGRWKSWTLAGLLGLVGLQSLAIIRLATRPPEVVLLDAAGGATPVRRSVATDALLAFLAERTRPPEVAVVRFTRDFLHLALALNSSTIEAAWPAALAMMAPELRARVEAEAASTRLVETWRLAQRKTELAFEEVVLEDRTTSLLAIRATLSRRTGPLVEGTGPSRTDRVQVEVVARIVAPTLERPDGLEVAEWRLSPLPVRDSESKPGADAKGVSDAP